MSTDSDRKAPVTLTLRSQIDQLKRENAALRRAGDPDILKSWEDIREQNILFRGAIERLMTAHWDMVSCQCWFCQMGRDVGCTPKEVYLQDLVRSDSKFRRIQEFTFEHPPASKEPTE